MLTHPVLKYTLSALLLGGLPAFAVQARDLRSAADAEDLCRTAIVEPPARSAPSTTPEDPLFGAQRRHDYSMVRNRRLTDVYTVLLDTREWGFMPLEPGLLTVATMRPFPLFGGDYELDLPNAPDVSFVLGEQESDEVLAGVASDQVQLRLHFHLISLDEPSRAYCETTERETIIILGRLLAAELLARPDQRRLTATETERYEWGHVNFGFEVTLNYQAPQPRVTVTSSAFSTPALAPAEAELLRVEAEALLMPCYMRGLNQNGRLQGAMVVSYQVGSGGEVSDPAVTLDAIDHPLVTGCAVGALREMTIERPSPADDFGVRMTVIFRLE